MSIMTVYKVEIEISARQDLQELLNFLKSVISREASYRYIDAMISEVNGLSVYADLYGTSRSEIINRIHPEARRMLSHNKKWNYIFHIEDEIVVVDRILASSTISK